jgi:phosphatidylglycerol lysyltransferase
VSATAADPRVRALAMLKRHGYNATSFQTLEEGFRYWFDGDEACVAYADTGAAWVVAGAPIAATGALAAVAARFQAAANAAGRRVCYFGVEQRMVAAGVGDALAIGAQPVWDPAAWPAALRGSGSLREQIRRARAKGVRVRLASAAEVGDPASPARRAVEGLIGRWLAARAMAPMGFLVDVQPFAFADERRYFLAERDGGLVGFLAAVPVYARDGWLLEDLLRDDAAPSGTNELLVDAAMREAAARGCGYVTLGLAPLGGDVDPRLRALGALSAGLYDFAGLYLFKSKLRPLRWDPIHLVHPRGTPAVVALFDVLTAFARGSLARYGLRSLLRGPAVVVRALGLLLAPWTALLLAADPSRWFAFPALKALSVLLNVALGGGLWALARRWRPPLATALAVAVTADAALTTAHAVAFGAARAHGAVGGALVAVSCLAPTLAAAVLWSARARLIRAAAMPLSMNGPPRDTSRRTA